jgi:hypothetical protein
MLGDRVCESAAVRGMVLEKLPSPSEVMGISFPDTLTIIAKSL